MSTSDQFAIALDPDSLSWTGQGTVSGRIAVWLGGHAFPDESWDDYPVPVLEWWCRACLDLAGGAGSARLELMDGPYSLMVRREPDGSLRLRPLRGDDPAPVTPHEPVPLVPSPVVQPADVIAAVAAAAGAVLERCDRRGWTSPDVDALRAARADLERLPA